MKDCEDIPLGYEETFTFKDKKGEYRKILYQSYGLFVPEYPSESSSRIIDWWEKSLNVKFYSYSRKPLYVKYKIKD